MTANVATPPETRRFAARNGPRVRFCVLALLVLLGQACSSGSAHTDRKLNLPDWQPPKVDHAGIHKIRHVIVIMQENRSFDSYFGTFPGADGIPMKNGKPTVCLDNPATGACTAPYHDPSVTNAGGPHTLNDAQQDVHSGRMDGFVKQAVTVAHIGCPPLNPNCSVDPRHPDVMGYHDQREIPNYWAYAHSFVLQDHMFASNLSWSLPSHLAMVSGWSAFCANKRDPMSCHSFANQSSKARLEPKRLFPWTDLTYLMWKHHVTWRYFVAPGTQPDCGNDAFTCDPKKQNAATPSIWNPLPRFLDVQQTGQSGNIVGSDVFFKDAQNGTLPEVSWVIPSNQNSEHPPASITAGQAWVTKLVNAVMRGPDWSSTAILVSWDDWGGFYDHVRPPTLDSIGYGIRVPGLVISPYARQGFVDHQTLSFDAYLKFIEDDFMGGARIDPRTDGRPDSRPNVREDAPILGDLARDFDFTQRPRSPLVLPPYPHGRRG